MTHMVLSDLHLGSPQCRAAALLAFLRRLPPGPELVLNGDVIDRRHQALPPEHQAVLDWLRTESARRSIVWVRGNHDAHYKTEDPGAMRFVETYRIGDRLWVAHGHTYDSVSPRFRPLLQLFRVLHRLRRLWAGDDTHVAEFAKRFPRLYRVLRENVAANAVREARAAGCAAVACGHIHHVEDRTIEGIRYLNTGAWTERPLCAVAVTATGLRLLEVDASGHTVAWDPNPRPAGVAASTGARDGGRHGGEP